jgi:hypothetical protein
MTEKTRRGSRRRAWRCAAIALAQALLCGCSSGPVKIGSPPPTTSPRLLGEARGSGCGLLFFNLLPFGVNGRVERAYAEAQIAAGKRDLTDTRVRERWYVIPLLATVLCTDIEETAVQ